MQSLGPPSAEGQVVAGKYRLVRLLGQGGMGAVYEGRNLSTMKRCAVKLLLAPELAMNPGLVKRFFREARACSVVQSDHVVEVFDSDTDPQTGAPYMVMEFLEGEDVSKVLERMGALEPVAAAKIVLQAAIGLAKAHEAGVVHRDIKPANLYVTRRDSGDLIIKVLDFGIAKVKIENFHETSGALTRTGSMLGSPLYMSPEQCKGPAGIDMRSDVWSLGVVLFELLSGAAPHAHHGSFGSLMAAIITDDLPLIQERAPWVAPELAEVVHRAMSRDLDRRYRSAGELRDALLQIVPGGALLMPEMLLSLTPEQRGMVAPRLVLSDDGMLRATARTGLSATQPGADKRSRAPFWVASLVAVLAAGVGTFVWQKRAENGADPSSSSSAVIAEPLPSQAVSVVERPPPPPVIKHFVLEVAPAGVVVSVDGAAVDAKELRVAIDGVVGATRQVRLSLRGKTEERTVAIAESGLVPDKLEIGVPSRPGRGGKPATTATAPTTATTPTIKTAAGTTTPTATAKPATNLRANTDEFGPK